LLSSHQDVCRSSSRRRRPFIHRNRFSTRSATFSAT
jgi:hypothetical protein